MRRTVFAGRLRCRRLLDARAQRADHHRVRAAGCVFRGRQRRSSSSRAAHSHCGGDCRTKRRSLRRGHQPLRRHPHRQACVNPGASDAARACIIASQRLTCSVCSIAGRCHAGGGGDAGRRRDARRAGSAAGAVDAVPHQPGRAWRLQLGENQLEERCDLAQRGVLHRRSAPGALRAAAARGTGAAGTAAGRAIAAAATGCRAANPEGGAFAVAIAVSGAGAGAITNADGDPNADANASTGA